MIKICAKCKQEFETSRPQWYCCPCDAQRAREAYAAKHGPRDRKRAADRFAVARAHVNGLKQGRPCMDCGGVFPTVAMQFDHRPGEVKVAYIARMVSKGMRLDIIDTEIKKCDLVCANCHAVRTEDRRVQAYA